MYWKALNMDTELQLLLLIYVGLTLGRSHERKRVL